MTTLNSQGAPVVVVSDRTWRAHFAGRSLDDAVLTLDGVPRTVVGVLPPEFGFSFIGIGGDVWAPLAPGPDSAERRVNVLARLKAGVTWIAAGAELDALARPPNCRTSTRTEQNSRTMLRESRRGAMPISLPLRGGFRRSGCQGQHFKRGRL